jgi:biotin synthase
MRLVEPTWLIPSVSALAKSQEGGQFRGFKAGANVLTINFTPDVQRHRYLIYGKDRFVVRRDYARELIAQTGMTLRGSVYVGEHRVTALPQPGDRAAAE